MKTRFALITAVALLLGSAQPSFALMEIADVSPQRAKELGITLQSRPNGDAGVIVVLEFKAAGELKNFRRVELRTTAGGKHLVSAPLQTTRRADGVVEAYFSTDPAQLAGSSFLIAVTDAPRDHTGYVLKVKDFVALEKSR